MKNKIFVKGLVLVIVVLFVGTGIVSAFNASLADESNTTITTNKLATIDNHPPTVPRITGPTIVTPGMHYWNFNAADPDGDNVSYEVEWGDGWYGDIWYGWYASDEEISIGHDYQGYGKVSLMARAKDIHNATGDWGIINIVLPKNTQIINLPFTQFFERFQNTFSILRHLLKL
jgi:hypothetical protein